MPGQALRGICWTMNAETPILIRMVATVIRSSKRPSPETEANRLRRIAHEAVLIAEADASIAAGRVVDEAEVDAWIDSIGTDNELPVPYAVGR